MAKRTLLVVEDDAPLRRMYRHALAVAGFQVREAVDGLDALRLIDVEPPEVIVLDLVLPGVDGFAVLAELAAQAQTRNIPVVVVTGLSRNLEALNVFCVLRKPASPEEVVAAVERCIASGAQPAGT